MEEICYEVWQSLLPFKLIKKRLLDGLHYRICEEQINEHEWQKLTEFPSRITVQT